MICYSSYLTTCSIRKMRSHNYNVLYREELAVLCRTGIYFISIIFTYRNSVLLRLGTDRCVGSSRCCVLLLGHNSSFQLSTIQRILGEDSYCSHHQCLTGSVSPTTICIATSCGWLLTVLFNSTLLYSSKRKLYLLHFDSPTIHFCWNLNIHTDLHNMDII